MFGMLGTLVNTAAVLVGSVIGLVFNKAIEQRLADALFRALGLCTLFIGITGVFQDGVNTLVIIISMVIGIIIGEGVDLDKRINNLGKWIENKLKKDNGQKLSVAQGFVSASLLFCVGAMTVVGSLQSGLTNDHTTLFTKSILDFVAAIIFASSLGIGVLFSALFVLVYQGVISFGSYCIAGLLVQNTENLLSATGELSQFMITVNSMNCAGYLIIIGLAFNMIGVTKLKVMNFVPAVFMPIIICPIVTAVSGLTV